MNCLSEFIPNHDKEVNLKDALEETTNAFLDKNRWGGIRESNINKFVNWLKENGIVESNLNTKELFTNKFTLSN